jgi:hypothetical protein
MDESRGSYLGDKGNSDSMYEVGCSSLCVIRVESQVNNRVVTVLRQVNDFINHSWLDSTSVDTKNPARHELPAASAHHEKFRKFIFMNARALLRI